MSEVFVRVRYDDRYSVRYNAAVVPASQVIVTSRAAFVLVTIGAWIGGTLSFVFVTWEEDIWADAVSNSIWALAWIVPLTLLGATVGAIIAMLCGCRLSRQLCWLFSVVAALLTVPLGVVLMIRISQMFPSTANRFARMQGPIILLPIIGLVLGGIVLGVLLTLTRTGFAQRARKAGAIAGVAGCVGYALLEFALYWIGVLRAGGVGARYFSVEWPWQAMLTFGSFTSVAAIAVAAAWYAERPMGRSYEVLPLASARTTEKSRAVEAL